MHAFPNIAQNFSSSQRLCERAILAPCNDAVDKINWDFLKVLPGQEQFFKSIDTVIDQDQAVVFPTEFLNSLRPSGMPLPNLTLKNGAPTMLLRNLDPPRLVVKAIQSHVLEVAIITGKYMVKDGFIPPIPLILSDPAFEFKRLQFPVKLSFAMSINKCQRQSLTVVRLNFAFPCFSHGQLYVGWSQFGCPKTLFMCTPVKGHTENIVYLEVLQN
ncbi:uncharacterized protein LOC128249180 [Octopus bimaculoides]|uniref:uncharacterized protein LOC128249180 n=1 Tax=Octopus bimaculoides TaxID=37653 RepID=UPI0022E4F716|nr:uncharacterized protein LOC128249180 [Octopus bimaculoides]